MKCPHAKIQYCPLYVGMHIAGGPSCWPKNNDLDEGCAVEQGEPYEELVAAFFRAHPDDFAEITLAERADEANTDLKATTIRGTHARHALH